MTTSVRELFCELVDISREEREKILAERRIPKDLCAEVESLLRYDAPAVSLTRCVTDIAQEALRSNHGPSSRYCGPYKLVRLLGSGGMGTVYLAERHDGEIEQKVAIKLLRADADRPTWRERFLRERQLLAYLNHPSIARLLDAGHTKDGRPYLVMEHVEGVTIDEYAGSLDLHSQLELFLHVCDGVAHAHRHLIIHRDLKPSNILVDSYGHPKLLDFGIAKLLDVTTDATGTIDRLLTPTYASPEQLRGDVQTTATDIYSLGAVLYRLLTGRPPRELTSDPLSWNPEITRDRDVTAPTQLNPNLPRDIDYILRKALRHEPSERYASVDAFRDDIRAVLELRPVQARSGDTWYRARKFLRRYRIAIIAATITIASLLLGLNIANRQRVIAQKRFLQVRQIANKVLMLDDVVGSLHNAPKSMHEIVAMSTEYLETLGAEAQHDEGLALEVVEAYSVLARAHGVCVADSAGQHAHAEQNLHKAEIFLKPILASNPNNRKALLTGARISHDRMILLESNRRRAEALEESRKAVGYLDRLLSLGNPSAAESQLASQVFYNVALSRKNLHLPDEGIAFAQRSVETARTATNAEWRLSMGLSMLADLFRLSGNLEEALKAIREARANLEKARFPSETERRASWCSILGREGKILGVVGGISMNRPAEAVPHLQQAFDLLEDWTQSNREDAWSRLLFATVGRELGDVLRVSDPQRALAVYDHALLRLREVQDNPTARRGEAEVLAASAYALRRLHRADEAKDRIDTTFRLLKATNVYPSEQIVPHEEAHGAFRALGDHFSETGQPQRAVEVYKDLLQKIMASKPDSLNDLRHALAFSQIYGSLAGLYRRTGESNDGKTFAALRLDLWSHWETKLPQSSFVRRELASARMQ